VTKHSEVKFMDLPASSGLVLPLSNISKFQGCIGIDKIDFALGFRGHFSTADLVIGSFVSLSQRPLSIRRAKGNGKKYENWGCEVRTKGFFRDPKVPNRSQQRIIFC
jgi:hypothetical protein